MHELCRRLTRLRKRPRPAFGVLGPPLVSSSGAGPDPLHTHAWPHGRCARRCCAWRWSTTSSGCALAVETVGCRNCCRNCNRNLNSYWRRCCAWRRSTTSFLGDPPPRPATRALPRSRAPANSGTARVCASAGRLPRQYVVWPPPLSLSLSVCLSLSLSLSLSRSLSLSLYLSLSRPLSLRSSSVPSSSPRAS